MWHEHVCPICNNPFYIDTPKHWAYKRYGKSKCYIYFCTWRCMRKFEQSKIEIKKCKFCGKEFIAKVHKTYCDPVCKERYNAELHKKQ